MLAESFHFALQNGRANFAFVHEMGAPVLKSETWS